VHDAVALTRAVDEEQIRELPASTVPMRSPSRKSSALVVTPIVHQYAAGATQRNTA